MTPAEYPPGSSLNAKIRLAHSDTEPGGKVYRIGKFKVEGWSPAGTWVKLHDVENGDTCWFLTDRVTSEDHV
jgi:hypothetical protein